MADNITTNIKNNWEDLKKDVKNSTTDNPLEKLKNDVISATRKTKNNLESTSNKSF